MVLPVSQAMCQRERDEQQEKLPVSLATWRSAGLRSGEAPCLADTR